MKISVAILLLTLCGAPSAMAWRGKVIEVIDGDQLRVRKGRTVMVIRLFGVDAPEPRQPFGEQAREFIAEALLNRVVEVEPAGAASRKVIVARIRIGRRVINEALLEAGLAWHYRAQDRTKHYEELERVARGEGRGLWAVKGRIPPWTWRGEGEVPSEEPLGKLMGDKIGEVYGAAAVDVTHPVTGDVKSKFYHWFTCDKAKCNSCTALFKTEAAARSAGYLPHKTCMPTDRCFEDCLQANATRAEGWQAIQASCRANCKTSVATARVAPPAPPKLPWSRELRCKRNKDCVFAHSPCSRCPACTPRWREVSNRATYRRQVQLYSRRRVKCSRCRRCPNEENHWLGTRAVCIKGQCQPR